MRTKEELKQVTGGLWDLPSPELIEDSGFIHPDKPEERYEIQIYKEKGVEEF